MCKDPFSQAFSAGRNHNQRLIHRFTIERPSRISGRADHRLTLLLISAWAALPAILLAEPPHMVHEPFIIASAGHLP